MLFINQIIHVLVLVILGIYTISTSKSPYTVKRENYLIMFFGFFYVVFKCRSTLTSQSKKSLRKTEGIV